MCRPGQFSGVAAEDVFVVLSKLQSCTQSYTHLLDRSRLLECCAGLLYRSCACVGVEQYVETTTAVCVLRTNVDYLGRSSLGRVPNSLAILGTSLRVRNG